MPCSLQVPDVLFRRVCEEGQASISREACHPILAWWVGGPVLHAFLILEWHGTSYKVHDSVAADASDVCLEYDEIGLMASPVGSRRRHTSVSSFFLVIAVSVLVVLCGEPSHDDDRRGDGA